MCPGAAAVWVADILKGELNYRDIGVHAFKVEDMIEIIELVIGNKITERSGVEIIRTILDNGGTPKTIVKEKGLIKVEEDIIIKAVTETLEENPEALQDYLDGKEKSLNFLVGQVMKKTAGRSDKRSTRKIVTGKYILAASKVRSLSKTIICIKLLVTCLLLGSSVPYHQGE